MCFLLFPLSVSFLLFPLAKTSPKQTGPSVFCHVPLHSLPPPLLPVTELRVPLQGGSISSDFLGYFLMATLLRPVWEAVSSFTGYFQPRLQGWVAEPGVIPEDVSTVHEFAWAA